MQLATQRFLFGYALFALAVITLAAAEDEVAAPLMIVAAFVLPAALLVSACSSRGKVRTFCLGALGPSAIALLFVAWPDSDVHYVWLGAQVLGNYTEWEQARSLVEPADALRDVSAATWLLSLLVGLLCVGMQRAMTQRPKDAAA